MAQLHPQECYLLEYLTSLEHYCNIRDAMIEVVRLGEQCLDEYMKYAPADLRSKHTSLQPDVVWGGRVLPNLRSSRDATWICPCISGHQTTLSLMLSPVV